MTRKCCGVLSFVLLTVSISASAAVTDFTLADVFNVEAASDPRISPDGQLVAYVRRMPDIQTDRVRSTIWLVDVKSGEQTPLVAGPGSHQQPRWSHDGKRIAYVSSAESGGAQLYVLALATRSASRITTLASSPGGLVWSPDDRRLAYLAWVPSSDVSFGSPLKRPEGASWAPSIEATTQTLYRLDSAGYMKSGANQLFVVSSSGGAALQITSNTHFVWEAPVWTPDGRELLFHAYRDQQVASDYNDTDIYAVDVTSGVTRAVHATAGAERAPIVSPDGRNIAFLGFEGSDRPYENSLLYVMGRDGSGLRAITADLDRSIDSAIWSGDGKSMYVQFVDRGVTHLAQVNLSGKRRVLASNLVSSEIYGPATGGEFSVSRDGIVAYTGGDTDLPADVWIAEGGKQRRLTRLNDELLAARAIAPTADLPVIAEDGLPIRASITLPPHAVRGQKYPLILVIHGGPYAAYSPAFSLLYQVYASAGYAVAFADPRGSTSYGAQFANQTNKSFPEPVFGDLMAVVNAAVATGLVDEKNLFVTGGSAGGILTGWMIGHTPRFRAAVMVKPMVNMVSAVLTTDTPAAFMKYWFTKPPWEDVQSYWRRSPLAYVGNISTPTMLIVGENDFRTPQGESDQFYAALKIRGIPAALVRVPGVGHSSLSSRPSQQAAQTSATLAWFEQHRADATP